MAGKSKKYFSCFKLRKSYLVGTSRPKKICVVSSNYPRPCFPEYGAFVEKLVKEWGKLGINVDVIAPYSVPDIFRSLNKRKVRDSFAGQQIIRPIYLSVSNKKIGSLDLMAITRNQLKNSVLKALKKIDKPDMFYGKFLMTGGYTALSAGKKYERPVIADLGESRLIERMDKEELELAKEIVPQFDGIACVSERLVNEVIELGADPEDVLYAPNTVDIDRFYPMDKQKCREELGLPQNDFIVTFVGHFIERKGPLRVLEAINNLEGNVKGIFMGRGEQKPKGKKVLHTGSVPNEELPIWLNAADVFVLPTLAEGNCNAINEAIACGLPIISSDIPDISLQVSDEMGLLVNPLDINAMAGAIHTLYTNRNIRKQYSRECLKVSKSRFSASRALKIINWLTQDLIA